MTHLLLCTDLDRTLLPNGDEPESPGARDMFALLAARAEVALAYVSGRHRQLVEEAIEQYRLPVPDFVIGDVGTTIYEVGGDLRWQRQHDWEVKIAADWHGRNRNELQDMLADVPNLELQEAEKQNDYKLSYYLPLTANREQVMAAVQARLEKAGVRSRLIYSVDEQVAVGLLDILPAQASKLHAIEELMLQQGLTPERTVFCGDSGNDLEVLASAIPSVLVGNSTEEVRSLARQQAASSGYDEGLYIAKGGFLGMNGNYAAGMLEGIAHYHPEALPWMGVEASYGACA